MKSRHNSYVVKLQWRESCRPAFNITLTVDTVLLVRFGDVSCSSHIAISLEAMNDMRSLRERGTTTELGDTGRQFMTFALSLRQ